MLERITGTRPFQVIGTDSAGTIMYCGKNKEKKQDFLTRAIHLELLPDQTTDEFILIVRKGCLETIYSDNVKWKFLNGSRKSTNQKFFITFLAVDVSSANSIFVKHHGREDSLRELLVWWIV